MEAENIYLELTRKFNTERLRAILSGGQAVVMHRLAIMSKDGDWILREDEECVDHILHVLESYGAMYRFGAPLDLRWLSGGWSSHFEFKHQGIRVRTDFVTRPPRISSDKTAGLWRGKEASTIPFLGAAELIETKMTNREKDYVVIGELARIAEKLEDKLKYSRSARELIELAGKYPEKIAELKKQRPLLQTISEGLEKLEIALDAERRKMIHANEKRLSLYMSASEAWARAWPGLVRSLKGESLLRTHTRICDLARELLPTSVPGGLP